LEKAFRKTEETKNKGNILLHNAIDKLFDDLK
jgi:hypothetical protein